MPHNSAAATPMALHVFLSSRAVLALPPPLRRCVSFCLALASAFPHKGRGHALHSPPFLKPRLLLTARLSPPPRPLVRYRACPAPVRPWHEVKSRRGAPKRYTPKASPVPNQQCPYFGITDAHIHALVGDGKHGRANRSRRFAASLAAPRSVSAPHALVPWYFA